MEKRNEDEAGQENGDERDMATADGTREWEMKR